MKKKIIAGVLALTLVMGSAALPSGVYENVAEKTGITASAVKVSGKYKYNILKNGTAEITKYTGSTKAVTIPSKIGGKKVTRIGNYAFRDCKNITNITIPNSVTSIGEGAFNNCKNITDITIPNSVTSIGDWAFVGCSRFTSITIPNSVTSIGDGAFGGCEGLTSITIPNSVTSISYDAFGMCTSLKSITIPNSIKKIDDWAFSMCEALESITIPNSVTSIGDSAFYRCTSLKDITIPNSVKEISASAFNRCTSLESITIPDNVKSIGNWVFQGCTNLKSITIPDSITSVGVNILDNTAYYNNQADGVIYAGNVACSYKGEMPKNTSIVLKSGTVGIADQAFMVYDSSGNGCETTALTNVTIPNSVKFIGNYAFCYCASLSSITIPDSVTSIGEDAFMDCTSLTSIDVDSNNTKYSSWDGILCNINKTNIICCPVGKKLTSITIPNNVTKIEEDAFRSCTSLTSIKIPDSVKSIGGNTFEYCTSLASINVDSNNKNYSSWNGILFNKNKTNIICCPEGTKLTSITIPKSVKSIEKYAFYDCTSLKSITIPNSVTSIGDYAFGYYYNAATEDDDELSGFKMTCYYDSAAGVYARKNKITCKYINYIGNNKIKLSKTSYSYSGKANKPAVTIMSGKTKLKNGKDYTYTYKNNKAIGTASVVIKGKGKYNGTKTVTFKINPKKQTVKLTSYNDAFKATWTKDSQATGYQVKYAKVKSFKDSTTFTAGKTITSMKIKGKNKTTYYVKVRTYKTVSGTKYYGAWSTAKAVKTK